ncbi:hypothetical protein DERP_008945 [Dermatophagoides pteronyssinus]|uniref:Uncharacterized protein n=1 Tax=Dermatophagoides pteronyssinus TaxID=6956 RepID=A0ABQ8JNL6_DERPT|nr:hypothetical protein DERP_008945 [Dermatophagoides pteronyssinus]
MQIDSHYFTILPAYDSIHFLILSHPFPIKSNDDDDDETEKPKKGRIHSLNWQRPVHFNVRDWGVLRACVNGFTSKIKCSNKGAYTTTVFILVSNKKKLILRSSIEESRKRITFYRMRRIQIIKHESLQCLVEKEIFTDNSNFIKFQLDASIMDGANYSSSLDRIYCSRHRCRLILYW